MIRGTAINCPDCGGGLKYYDRVTRTIKVKGGDKRYLKLKRFKCTKCYKLHRELPEFIFPYKQYEADIIKGVLEGYITPETFGFEDYPCEMTMNRWTQKHIF